MSRHGLKRQLLHDLIHHHDREERLLGLLTFIATELIELDEDVDRIEHLVSSNAPTHGNLNLTVTAVAGKESAMPLKTLPPLSLSDVERVQLSLSPKLADGSSDPGPFSWSSDNTSIATVVGDKLDADGTTHIPDETDTTPTGPTAWALTPAGHGSANITALSASPNVNGNLLPLVITEARTGDVNLTAGTPVSDL